MTKHKQLHHQLNQFLQAIEPKGELSEKEYQGWVFFLEIDHILLDTDLLREAIKSQVIRVLGPAKGLRFWVLQAEFKRPEKLMNFPRIIRDYCQKEFSDTSSTKLHDIFSGIEYKDCVFPQVEQTLIHLKQLWSVSIFTQGDHLYQETKITNSGLADKVDQVFLYQHKLDHLQSVVGQYADKQPVFVETRAENLVTIKQHYPDCVTMLVCQDHYNRNDTHREHFEADITIEKIQDLMEYEFE